MFLFFVFLFFFFYSLFFFFLFVFFFSSRRRHTRCLSDWSSDVCSSDLCRKLLVKNLRLNFVAMAGHAGRETGGQDSFQVTRRSRRRTPASSKAAAQDRDRKSVV